MVTVLVATACSDDVVPSLVQDRPTVAVDAERLALGAPSVALLLGDRALMSDGARVWLLDPRRPEPVDLAIDASEVRGGVWLDGDLLAATEDGLYLWDGLPWPSPLQEAIGEPALALIPDASGAWWLLDDTGWRRRAEGAISRIRVDGIPARGPLALDGVIDGTPVTWLTSKNGPADPVVVAIDGAGALRDSASFEDVRSLAVDARGHAWVADGRTLHGRSPGGTWTRYPFASGVAEVRAHAAADRLWVRTVDAVYSGTSEGVSPVDVPDGRWLGVDPLGRLLVADGDGVQRLSLDLPVAVLDVPAAPIDTPTTLTVSPTLAADVVSVDLALDGDAITTSPPTEPPWSWTIDPAQFEAGSHTLTASVVWADGRDQERSVPVTLGAGEVTWEDVLVLFEDRCQQCHGGASETVLETPEAWIARFDRILELVETEQMPLGLEPLPESERALLRAWRAGGFL